MGKMRIRENNWILQRETYEELNEKQANVDWVAKYLKSLVLQM